MFVCPCCNKDVFGADRCDECPHIYHNIVNVTMQDVEKFSLENFKEDWPIYFKKYDRDGKSPREGVIYQYNYILNKINMREGVLLDFGCALAHASDTVKKHSKNITYIGVDSFEDVLFAASELYEPDYLLNIDVKKIKLENKKEELFMFPEPLRYLRDESVDLIVASRIAGWSQYDKFFPEFYRVLKPGGKLFFWSNAGHFDGKKKEMFEFLNKHFKPIKKRPKIGDSQALSGMMWGNNRAFQKRSLSEKELRHRFRGLMEKRAEYVK